MGLDVFPGMSGAGSTNALGEAEASAGVEAGLATKVERVGPKDGRAVKSPVAGDRVRTLSCSCPAQKRKDFVSRVADHGA